MHCNGIFSWAVLLLLLGFCYCHWFQDAIAVCTKPTWVIPVLGPCFYSQSFCWVGMASCVLCRISYSNYSCLTSVLNLFFLNLSLCHNWESSTGNVHGKSETINILYYWCRLRLKYSIALCASHLSRNSFAFVRKQAFIRNALEYKLATQMYWLALQLCIGQKKKNLFKGKLPYWSYLVISSPYIG